MGPRQGSILRNRTAAGALSRCGIRSSAACWFSTEVPSQRFGRNGRQLLRLSCGQSPVTQALNGSSGIIRAMFSGRFVSSSQSRFGVASMSAKRRVRTSCIVSGCHWSLSPPGLSDQPPADLNSGAPDESIICPGTQVRVGCMGRVASTLFGHDLPSLILDMATCFTPKAAAIEDWLSPEASRSRIFFTSS